MGCLCSRSVINAPKGLTRSATSYATRDLELSFHSSFSQRSFFSEYRLQKDPIGSGLVGEIRLCTDLSSEKVFAVKIISKAGLPQEDLKKRVIDRQIKILQSLDHPAILKLHDSFEDSSSHYLVMDHVKGGDLFSAIERWQGFSEPVAAKIIKQLLSALAYMHKLKIAHRDIKPENLLVEEQGSDFIVKLIDFDTAVRLEEGKPIKGIFGTVYYMAPELIQGEYTEKCDVWSAGVILYSLVTNCFPFGGRNDDEIMKNITGAKLNHTALSANWVSPELVHLIRGLLHPNPSKRLSASDAINHVWIQTHTGGPCRISPPVMTHKPDFRCFLAQALRHWAIKHLVPSHEVASCHFTFLDLDKNFDGVISKEELADQFGKSDNLEMLMEIADLNANGVLEYHEFLSIMVNAKGLTKYAEEMFKLLDKKNLGKISVAQLSEFLDEQFGGNLELNGGSDNLLDKSITMDDLTKMMDCC